MFPTIVSGVPVKSVLSPSGAGFRTGARPVFRDFPEQENSSIRYSRVANLEMVLSIRDRRRTERRLIVAGLLIAGSAAIVAGVLGVL
jgi:hypothetical protein